MIAFRTSSGRFATTFSFKEKEVLLMRVMRRV